MLECLVNTREIKRRERNNYEGNDLNCQNKNYEYSSEYLPILASMLRPCLSGNNIRVVRLIMFVFSLMMILQKMWILMLMMTKWVNWKI